MSELFCYIRFPRSNLSSAALKQKKREIQDTDNVIFVTGCSMRKNFQNQKKNEKNRNNSYEKRLSKIGKLKGSK